MEERTDVETSQPLDQYHPLDPVAAFHVRPKLDELRASCPAFQTTNASFPPVTFFTRYEDVAAILRDYKTFRNMGTDVRAEDYEQIPPEQRIHIQLNPPEHTEVRRLLLAAVAPPVVKRVVPRIEQLGDEVVGRFKDKGRADLVAEWASTFPALATSFVLGFPETDGEKLHAWVQSQFADEVLQQHEAEYGKSAANEMGEWFDGYLREQLALRRDGTITDDDGISRIMNYEPKRGYPFTDDELVLHLHSLIVAANETTTGFMSNVIRRILATPGLFEQLREDRSLVEPAIEEAGRTDPALLLVTRGCQKATTVGGVDLHPGDGVVLSLASANRDEAVWGEDAGEFDPQRFVDRHDREIMTFGMGIHFCPGAYLARLETKIALNALLDHTRNMRLAPDFSYDKVWFYLLDRPKEVLVEFDPID